MVASPSPIPPALYGLFCLPLHSIEQDVETMHSAPVCGLSFPKVFHPIGAAERKEPALSDFVDDLSNCPSRDALSAKD